ncbi:MAG: hypothetical protein ACRDTT_16150 [Pseudonocardiaceae bacterium]
MRELLPDWEMTSRRFLAEFRAEAGPRLGEPPLCDLIQRLTSASDAFRVGWDSHAVGGFASRERIFRHPEAGELRFEHHQLTPADHQDLQLIIYVPLPSRDTASGTPIQLGQRGLHPGASGVTDQSGQPCSGTAGPAPRPSSGGADQQAGCRHRTVR